MSDEKQMPNFTEIKNRKDGGRYSVEVRCQNCGFHDEEYSVKKGVHVTDTICPRCGCCSLLSILFPPHKRGVL